MAIDKERLAAIEKPTGLPFHIGKLGHIVLHVTDMERSVRFYVEVLGFQISDIYEEDMMPGGMVFMRWNPDHHGIALVGGLDGPANNRELNHLAFEVSSLDEVILVREHLKAHGVQIDFDGRRRAGCQIAVEFRDPDNHRLEVYWGLDQIGSDGRARPASQWKGARTIEAAIADPVEGQDLSLRDPSLLKA